MLWGTSLGLHSQGSEESRHWLSTRHLAPTSWTPSAFHALSSLSWTWPAVKSAPVSTVRAVPSTAHLSTVYLQGLLPATLRGPGLSGAQPSHRLSALTVSVSSAGCKESQFIRGNRKADLATRHQGSWVGTCGGASSSCQAGWLHWLEAHAKTNNLAWYRQEFPRRMAALSAPRQPLRGTKGGSHL